MKKYLIILSLAFLVSVSLASAQEYAFSRDLSVGTTGADVSALQSWLITNGYDIPAISSGIASKGYFGSQTRSAVVRFQLFFGLPGTGYFGQLSRGKIGEKKYTDGRAPIINGIDAPTTLNAQQVGTWTVRVTDPQNGTLSYHVDWGDAVACPFGYTCGAPGITPISLIQQTAASATFTHSYVNAGNYVIKFTVKNNLGLSAQSSVTVQAGPINGPGPLSIRYPNGGENWQKGTNQTIFWNSPAYFRATYADIMLVPYYPQCTGQICPMVSQNSMMYPHRAPYTIATNVSINQNSYIWNVGTVTPTSICPPGYSCDQNLLPDGQYTIQICETGTNNCDSSDKPFTISSPALPSSVNVISPNGGEVWPANSTHRIAWSMTNLADANAPLDIYLGPAVSCGSVYACPLVSSIPSYVLDKNIMASTVYNWIVATDINNASIPNGNYKVRVCKAGFVSDCDSSDTSFTIGGTI